MNDNPLQGIPAQLTDCRYLGVLNLARTYVKTFPMEFCLLKNLFDLDVTACPLRPLIREKIDQGIVAFLAYMQEKMDREKYREKIVKACKEEVWVDEPTPRIKIAIDSIFEFLEDEDIYLLKRLLRNLKYMVPLEIEQVDPYRVKENLKSSKVEANKSMSKTGQFTVSVSRSMNPNIQILQGSSGFLHMEDQSMVNEAQNHSQSAAVLSQPELANGSDSKIVVTDLQATEEPAPEVKSQETDPVPEETKKEEKTSKKQNISLTNLKKADKKKPSFK